MNEPERKQRKLHFANPDELALELDRLLDSGYVCQGNWNLSQACGHVAMWMQCPMAGYPRFSLPMRLMVWLMKVAVGGRMREKILREGFSAGLKTVPNTIPEPDAATDRQSVDELKQVAERLEKFSGSILTSPLFGDMDRETTLKFHLQHAAHHLGFLQPKT